MSKAVGAAKGGIRAWLLPEINDIKVQLAEIKGEIKSTNTRIDSLKDQMENGDEKLAIEIASLRELVNLTQRVTILEAKQKESERVH